MLNFGWRGLWRTRRTCGSVRDRIRANGLGGAGVSSRQARHRRDVRGAVGRECICPGFSGRELPHGDRGGDGGRRAGRHVEPLRDAVHGSGRRIRLSRESKRSGTDWRTAETGSDERRCAAIDGSERARDRPGPFSPGKSRRPDTGGISAGYPRFSARANMKCDSTFARWSDASDGPCGFSADHVSPIDGDIYREGLHGQLGGQVGCLRRIHHHRGPVHDYPRVHHPVSRPRTRRGWIRSA